MQLELNTERLFLRPLILSDAHALFNLMSDKAMTTYLTWEPHETLETTTKVIQSLINSQKDDKGYHWCINLNNDIIGLCSSNRHHVEGTCGPFTGNHRRNPGESILVTGIKGGNHLFRMESWFLWRHPHIN